VIEVLSGVRTGEMLVVRPGGDLPEGTEVDPVPLESREKRQ
jgi:hypothetical protein